MQADTTIAVLDTAAVQTAQTVQPLERVMLAEDKLPVVLAVVLVVWIGIVFLLGTAYSLPPLRLKRFPFFAASAITLLSEAFRASVPT